MADRMALLTVDEMACQMAEMDLQLVDDDISMIGEWVGPLVWRLVHKMADVMELKLVYTMALRMADEMAGQRDKKDISKVGV